MSRMVCLVVSIALSSTALTGCLMPKAGAPHTGAVATGAPLAVVDDVKVWTTTQKEKVATTEYKDSDGNSIGTADVYADKTEVHSMKIWYPVQGTEQLADEDFFRIAGDQAALDATLELRASGARWHTRGLYALGGGVAASIVSLFLPGGTPRTLLATGGTLTALGGYYASWYGARMMDPETHAVDRSLADKAAHDYNQGLGKSVGLSYAGSF
jgi:hypothetical protein